MNKRYSENHFGLQTRCNTVLAIAELVEKQRFIMSNKKLCVFLEFNKAFDTVHDNLMIEKMENYGVREVILSWFGSYFLNQQQTVIINGAFSDSKVISSVVPKGSTSGCLFRIIYTNNFLIFISCNYFDIYMFALDTTLIYFEETMDDRCTGLTLIARKSGLHVIFFICKIRILNSCDFVNRWQISVFVRYLGIYLDRILSFDVQVDKFVKLFVKAWGCCRKSHEFRQ